MADPKVLKVGKKTTHPTARGWSNAEGNALAVLKIVPPQIASLTDEASNLRARRDDALVALFRAGWSYVHISEQCDLSDVGVKKAVQKRLAELEKLAKPNPVDPSL